MNQSIMIAISILAILLILSFWRRMHQRLVEQAFKFKVSELQDKMRRLVIDGTVQERNHFYQFLEVVFDDAKKDAYYLTLFLIALRSARNKRDERYQKFKVAFDQAMSENHELSHIYKEYRRHLHHYLVRQHYIGYTFFLKPCMYMIIGAQNGREKIRDLMNSSVYQSNGPQPI